MSTRSRHAAPRSLLLVALMTTLCCAGTTGSDDAATGSATDAESTPATERGESAAQPAAPKPSEGEQMAGEIRRGTANVDSVDLVVLKSFPLQVRAQVSGTLPDACTEIGEVSQRIEGDTIAVTITTERPAAAMCAQVIRHFERTIDLDVHGLDAGTYTVDVNGVTEQIDFERDNRLSPDR